MERVIDPSTGEPSGEEVVVKDTPLLINIKGCGYPPEVNCDEYAEFFSNQSDLGLTFPCHYSKMNPWIVLSAYNEWVTFTMDIPMTMEGFNVRKKNVEICRLGGGNKKNR